MQLGFETFRTRFGNDIVAEFRPALKDTKKVAILLPGCPGYPLGKRELFEHLTHHGFFTIIPSYRGTWESEGSFLQYPPSDDVEILIDQIPQGFIDLWSGAEYRIRNPEIYLIGGSFGGAAAILSSKHPLVKKVATISAVVDWREQQHTVEPLDLMNEYLGTAFGNAYRGEKNAYKKLETGDFYNPASHKKELDGTKLLLIHAVDDKVVHPGPAEAFGQETGAKFVQLLGGGHMGVGYANKPHIWKHIEKFFKEH